MAGGREGFVLSKRPKAYKLLPQQRRFKEASEACGIKKGMKREDLITAMKVCIPEFYAKQKEGVGESAAPSSSFSGGYNECI